MLRTTHSITFFSFFISQGMHKVYKTKIKVKMIIFKDKTLKKKKNYSEYILRTISV